MASAFTSSILSLIILIWLLILVLDHVEEPLVTLSLISDSGGVTPSSISSTITILSGKSVVSTEDLNAKPPRLSVNFCTVLTLEGTTLVPLVPLLLVLFFLGL